ncbi:MAG: hypothetical protein GF320_19890, partial [Armatimonadia bacterium]|nr:hypothetical protein [Armatimonadia bacterium]
MLPRAALLTLLALPVLAQPPLDELGRDHKLRILVDKVMQPEADWVTEEWMVAETAEMGFNVFSPRLGHDDLDAVEQVTRWCEDNGLYHMPWMRGSLTAPGGPEADGRRMVWDSGEESPLWSPCSDEFWEWTTRYVVAYAEMSALRPGLIGVFLDYENYAAGGPGMLYELSYDAGILARFAEDQGVDIPDLPPRERRGWLEAEGLHDSFQAFQHDHWRQRCIELRRRVDAHNPAFMFCIYPAPGSPFMIEGCYEWATDAAPLILADAVTYGRPGRFAPQDESLETNRTRLIERREVAEAAGIHYLYAGGIDPVVQGADPEFCGKNAVAISDVTDGYWVFYEGPTYDGTHPEYRRWFTWANRAIQAGEPAAWREPRETPVDLALDWIDRMGWQGLAPLDPEAAGGDLPPVSLRGRHLLLVSARAGEPLGVTLA